MRVRHVKSEYDHDESESCQHPDEQVRMGGRKTRDGVTETARRATQRLFKAGLLNDIGDDYYGALFVIERLIRAERRRAVGLVRGIAVQTGRVDSGGMDEVADEMVGAILARPTRKWRKHA